MDNQNQFNQAPVPANDGKNQSVLALICGIVSIVLGLFSGLIPFAGIIILVAAILGIVFGVKGRGASIKAYGKASGIATAGFVLGIVALCLSPITLICNICATCTACAACGAANELGAFASALEELGGMY